MAGERPVRAVARREHVLRSAEHGDRDRRLGERVVHERRRPLRVRAVPGRRIVRVQPPRHVLHVMDDERHSPESSSTGALTGAQYRSSTRPSASRTSNRCTAMRSAERVRITR